MKRIKIPNGRLSDRQLDEIAETLDNDGVIIWPTDTMYGIACSALSPKGIEKVCRIKGINPAKTNLSIACSSISQAAEYGHFDNSVYRLLRDNTPGAFTFLCKSSAKLPKVFKGRKVVGIRIPASEVALSVIERMGTPLLTSSVEYEDEDYARNPELIGEAYQDRVDLIIEGDDGDVEMSTIVDCTGSEPEIIRQGKGTLY